MPYFNEEHPLHEFNKDFYIESGKEQEHIYIFKFESKGAKVVLDLTNKDEPLAFLYPLIFINDYAWDTDLDDIGVVITGGAIDDILIRIQKELRSIKDGKRTSENR